MNGVFISWTHQNGRTADLASVLGLKAEYVRPQGNLVSRYLRSAAYTHRIIKRRTGLAVVMLPPTPALIAAAVANFRKPKRGIVFDLHTGFFLDPKWRPLLRMSLKLMRGYTAIVTNDHLARIVVDAGVNPVVLDDPIFDLGTVQANERQRTIVCPLSYANDEPVLQLLDACRKTPDITWTFTGKAPSNVVESAPENVVFTGFLSDGDLDRLLKSASAVAALTDRADTMQRAGYESLMRSTPLLVSSQAVLRDYFGSAAVYTDNSVDSLAKSALEVMEGTSHRIQAMESLRDKKIREQEAKIRRLMDHVSQMRTEA